jgi:CobW/HypB/UreG, nucleotide-binding domain
MTATLCLVSGFLGAGKTTTLLAAARELRLRGHRPAIVTNDQGRELVDTQLARTVTDAVGEVVDGCFCCRFEDLAKVVTTLVRGGADVVLAEAVGSCTDLRATVVRPLLAHHGEALRVAPLTTVVDPARYRTFARAWATGADPDTGYLFAHQLAEADVLALNKVDLLGASAGALTAELTGRCPSATVIGYSARCGAVGELVDLLLGQPVAPARPDVALDYDRYAAAEAGLAWLNHVVTVADRFDPALWAGSALSELSSWAVSADALVGHAKVSVSGAAGLTKASLTAAGDVPSVDVVGPAEVLGGRVTINLRIGCAPEELDRACAAAVAAADRACGVTSAADSAPPAFPPAYPRPTHRIPAG